VNERVNAVTVVTLYVRDERSDGVRVREIARVAAGRVPAGREIGDPLLRGGGRTIHEHKRRAEVGEGVGDHLADLALSAYAGQYDGRTGIHERGSLVKVGGLSLRITMAWRARPH
jgi:hypothetical protein